MTKSISIVIPAYNEARFIRACLESIAAQTVPAEDVIVVDNNSSDETVAIAGSFPFVRVITAREQGIVHARNAGFDAALEWGSDIIGRIDADSRLPADWVARVKEFYSHDVNANKALTGGGYFYNVQLPRFNGWIQSQFAYRVNRLIVGYYVLWGSNMAMPRYFWPDVRDKVCLRNDLHEDLDLAMHLHAAGHKIHYQADLRVGVYLKRVIEDKHQLREHMRRWPRTLRRHQYKKWWLGVAGNMALWFAVQPMAYALDALTQLVTGRRVR